MAPDVPITSASSDTPTAPRPIEQAASDTAPERRTLRRRNRLSAWLFLLPALLLQLTWGWYPLAIMGWLSLTDGQVLLPTQFIGLSNYIRVLNDPLVWQAFQVTLTLTAFRLVLAFLLPIFVAIIILELPRRWIGIIMTIWFLPLSQIAQNILYKYLYNSQYGLFQYIFVQVLHLPPQGLLNDPKSVIFWLVFPNFIFFAPGLLYLGVLQGIPASYYEAAEIEGAGFWRKIWTISLPRLRPIISVTLLLEIVNGLQEYLGPLIQTNGGPEGASRTIVYYIYTFIQQVDYATATTLSILLFILLAALTLLARRLYPEDPDR